MNTFICIAFVLGYYAALIAIGVWFGFKAFMLAILATCCAGIASKLSEKHISDEELKHDSCIGCKHNLGGGHCRVNLEGECREGGGYEAWED